MKEQKFRAQTGWLFFLACTILIVAGCQEAQNTEVSDADASEPSEERIFDGESLEGWDGDERFWSVEDGVIVGETSEDTPAEANTFLIWEGGEPADFELTFDYRFRIVGEEEYGNSGIQVRSERFTDEDNPELEHRVRGYQADFATEDWIPGILYEEGTGRDVLARRGERVHIDEEGERHVERFGEEEALGQHIRRDDDWNAYRVEARGDTLRAWIGEELMHEVIDESPEAKEEGLLAFQVHSGPPMRVELREVMLRRLD